MLAASLLGVQVEPAAAQTSPGTSAMYAYVGSFTTAQRKARGDGIHVYRADPATGALTHIQHIGDLVNPSYLALSRDQRLRSGSTPAPASSRRPAKWSRTRARLRSCLPESRNAAGDASRRAAGHGTRYFGLTTLAARAASHHQTVGKAAWPNSGIRSGLPKRSHRAVRTLG